MIFLIFLLYYFFLYITRFWTYNFFFLLIFLFRFYFLLYVKSTIQMDIFSLDTHFPLQFPSMRPFISDYATRRIGRCA